MLRANLKINFTAFYVAKIIENSFQRENIQEDSTREYT